MAHDTRLTCRNLVIYEVFVRNHGPSGTFADVEADLERIRKLGVDVLWFMPIHPIGQLWRKGTLGCPYSVRDYWAINPEYGTAQDFRRLIERAHECQMKVMMDMVFNHAARDSDLVRDHLEWFHRGADGGPYRASQGWTDVVGFKHPHGDLSACLIDILKYWAAFGVDAFRCDVASLLPREFWLDARRQACGIRPDLLWMAESVTIDFVAFERAGGRHALSDCELYEAFDLTFDYDLWPIWQATVVGQVPVSRYLEMLRFQDCIYPANYAKLRCVEHHDSLRIMALAATRAQALAWSAFQSFNKGAFLIYAGQEAAATRTPSLFDPDKIEWGGYELQPFLARLAQLKKDPAELAGQFVLVAAEPAIQAAWCHDAGLYGIFNVAGSAGETTVPLPDGVYCDLLNQADVAVRNGRLKVPEIAAILRCHSKLDLKPVHSDLIDFRLA